MEGWGVLSIDFNMSVYNFNRTIICLLEMMSEAIKILKGEYTVRAIREHNMDKAIIFCRTKLDCDNMERYLNQQGTYVYV